MSGEAPRFHVEVRQAHVELATPVEGELRREPVADAEVPCPRCGARAWLLIERRAEAHLPFTRWAALACAKCGAADGWESAGRARRGRAERDEQWVLGLPDAPTLDQVCRLASFRVFAASPSPALRSSSHVGDRLTGVTVASGGVAVTTEIRYRLLYPFPIEPEPEHRARYRLQQLLDDPPAVLQKPRSEPAQQAAAASAREAMIDVDGASVAFALVEAEGCWAAVADIGDESVTVAARGVRATAVALQALPAES